MLDDVRAMRMKVESAKRKADLEKKKNELEKKKQEIDSKSQIITKVAEDKKNREREMEKNQSLDMKLHFAKLGLKYATIAASLLIVTYLTVQSFRYAKQQKSKYDKYKVVAKASDTETIKACDFAKKFVAEYSSNGESVNELWAEMDEDEKAGCEVALRQLNPADVTFNAVEKMPGTSLKVIGEFKGKPVSFLLVPWENEFLLRYVEVRI